MQRPEAVTAMLHLTGAGVSLKRIAVGLGCSRNTVRRDLRARGRLAPASGESREGSAQSF
jgi:DeoR/GlpR family transcriptional regulator of sugar metabolism